MVVGIGERAEGRGVLDQAADGVDAQVGEAGVALAGQERLIVFPERQVSVHARAVVAEERLGHERRGLAAAAGDVADDVLGRDRPGRHFRRGAAAPGRSRTGRRWRPHENGRPCAMPHSAMRWAISERRSTRLSVGGQGK